MKIADLDFEPLISTDTIEDRVKAIGAQLNADYKDTKPLFVGVLNGSFMFIAELIKQIDIPCEITFTKLASYYGGTASSGKIREDIDISIDIIGRDLILVEDIIETGNTLNYLIEKLSVRKPASITACTLLLKPGAMLRKIPELKYTGFEIDNDFVIGYGLDYKEQGRYLKGIFKKV
jgi:hypoxanthine phosphoribosyltransferase